VMLQRSSSSYAVSYGIWEFHNLLRLSFMRIMTRARLWQTLTSQHPGHDTWTSDISLSLNGLNVTWLLLSGYTHLSTLPITSANSYNPLYSLAMSIGSSVMFHRSIPHVMIYSSVTPSIPLNKLLLKQESPTHNTHSVSLIFSDINTTHGFKNTTHHDQDIDPVLSCTKKLIASWSSVTRYRVSSSTLAFFSGGSNCGGVSGEVT